MRLEAAFFESVRVLVMRILYNPSGKKFSLKEINDRINEFLKQSVKSDGVINLFSDVGEKINLFDPTFLENISKMKEKNLAVEMLKKLIDEQVKIYKRTNRSLQRTHPANTEPLLERNAYKRRSNSGALESCKRNAPRQRGRKQTGTNR